MSYVAGILLVAATVLAGVSAPSLEFGCYLGLFWGLYGYEVFGRTTIKIRRITETG